jgi:hypothetical protein
MTVESTGTPNLYLGVASEVFQRFLIGKLPREGPAHLPPEPAALENNSVLY